MGNKASASKQLAPKIEVATPETGQQQQQLAEESKHNTIESPIHQSMALFMEGNRNFKRANYQLAREFYIRALKSLERLSPTTEQSLHQQEQLANDSTVLSNMGILEFAEGRYHEAKELHEKALAKRRSMEDIHHKGLEQLALDLNREYALHRVSDDIRQLISSIRKHEQTDALVADSLNNLAACHEIVGDLEQACILYEESLNIRTVIFGEKGILTAESMQNLATVLSHQGKLTEAEQCLKQVLDIYVERFGENSAEVAVALNNNGVLLTEMNEFEQAKQLLEKAVQIRKHHFGEGHHYTINAKQNLQYVLNKQAELEL